MKPTKADVILAASLVVAVLLVAGVFFLLSAKDRPLVAVVTVEGVEYARLPLDIDTTLTLPTHHTLVIKGGEASITSAPCPDLVCAHTPSARAVGNCIICLPEQVVIMITEEETA